ncbi:sulfite oxidase heme-binding subunit YedZ [Oricola thermophila]|uniref:Ferric reductase-like transmembrane domain-containing protein n=1 Tax=Oricola thermophila TaxID=2742145 RepID=A0A6N1V8A5_9HYPH|nr:ferric reductase-like transmembrane domain-containing protein [Oricola thermophila]QKV17134.1 ferric reductase-like transmembrane domain-containing protein [Oricola thermophila]
MSAVTRIAGSPWFVWALLALPAVPMMSGLVSGGELEELLHPTGEFAARFMIVAMLATPLRMLFPKARWAFWMVRKRRWFGVAAFGYAALHTLLYIVDTGSLSAMAREFFELGIWTGWAAFAIFVPLAVTSNDASVRALMKWWKPLQRWVYPAAVLTLLHWIFVHNDFAPALIHFVPLALLEAYRIRKNLQANAGRSAAAA